MKLGTRLRLASGVLVLILAAAAVVGGTFVRGLVLGFLGAFAALLGTFVIISRTMKKRVGERLRPPPLPTGRWDYAMEAMDLDGGTVRFSDFAGKVLVLNFWATWCAPCLAEMPALDRLRQATADLDVHFACITREDAATVQRFLEKRPLPLPIYRLDAEPPECFQGRAIPATFILDRTGLIALRHFGAAAWDAPSVVTFVRGLAAAPVSA